MVFYVGAGCAWVRIVYSMIKLRYDSIVIRSNLRVDAYTVLWTWGLGTGEGGGGGGNP